MCTVTIIPKGKNDFVLTSNRDEAPNRISLAPQIYTIDGTKMMFPKDEVSGGTWIGVSEKNRLVCVLNGGFEKHERKQNYRLSRGLVAKDFLVSDAVEFTLKGYDLTDIEPFTMVIADWNPYLKFYELVWDGFKKHATELPLESKIWSSATLYNQIMRQERSQWFETFRRFNDLKASSLLEFHKSAGNGNKNYGVVMDRGFVKTTSITQVEKTADTVEMIFENLQSQTVTNSQFNLPQVVND